MLRRLLAAWLLLWSLATFAEGERNICTRVFADAARGLSASEQFWAQNQDATIATANGPKSFAFGFDAELWHVSDVISLISKDPAAMELAKRKLTQAGLVYGHKKMANYLGYDSVADFREDALLPEAQDRDQITLFDIKPSHYSEFRHGHKEKSQYAKALTSAVTLSLNHRGIPVEAKFETYSGSREQGSLGNGSAIELIQKGSMKNTMQFRDLIENFLYAEVDFPETHFHVSVPTDAASAKEMLLAARALEAKITLEEVLEKMDYDGTLYPYDWSAIAKEWDPATAENTDVDFVQRGIVRVSLNRWPTPYPAHDVEIRMWFDAKHGMENMHFMMELIKNKDRLRDTTGFTADHVGNVVPANLNATLRYTSLLLKDRLPEDKKFILADLERFADQIERAKKLTDVKRREVAKYFRDHNVLKYVTLDTFLEPRSTTAPVQVESPASSLPIPPAARYEPGSSGRMGQTGRPDPGVPVVPRFAPGPIPQAQTSPPIPPATAATGNPIVQTNASTNHFPGVNYIPFAMDPARQRLVPPASLGWPPRGYAYRMVNGLVYVLDNRVQMDFVGPAGNPGR